MGLVTVGGGYEGDCGGGGGDGVAKARMKSLQIGLGILDQWGLRYWQDMRARGVSCHQMVYYKG